MEFNTEKVKDEIVDWIKNWFENNGKNCTAVIGISGGKDSSVVTALCVEALGKNRVFGILMPNGEQKDIDCAYKLVEHLGIDYIVVNINDADIAITDNVEWALDRHLSEQARTNLPARIRMTTLYAIAQTINGRVANTCNLSETLVSWETKWGDNVGDFAPIQDLTVNEVKQIGYCLGLPKELIEKAPSDGLCGKTDEEGLGFTYNDLDGYIRTGNIDNDAAQFRINERVVNSKFKRETISLPHYHSKLPNYLKILAY